MLEPRTFAWAAQLWYLLIFGGWKCKINKTWSFQSFPFKTHSITTYNSIEIYSSLRGQIITRNIGSQIHRMLSKVYIWNFSFYGIMLYLCVNYLFHTFVTYTLLILFHCSIASINFFKITVFSNLFLRILIFQSPSCQLYKTV